MRLGATRRQSWCPGTARSRENAKSIRDADVTDAVRQKSCATQQMKSRNVPQLWPMAATQLVGMMYRSIVGSAGSASVTATSRMNPKKTEATTDMYIPTAAEREALCVSSATCAEASKPVIVYWAIRSPVRNTYQKTMLPNPVAPSPPQPVALTVSVKIEPNDRWSSGTSRRTMTTTPTPIMCQ